MRRVPYVDLARQFADDRDALMAACERSLATGVWAGGGEVEDFEEAIAAFHGADHAVALASGTDALILALRALGIGLGDEVITPPNSFVASTAAIALVGATPVFADVRADQNIDPDAIERAITPRTRAIMPVHLTGRVAAMDAVMEIARRHRLRVVEDAAQAIGSRYRGRLAGTFGDIGCFSAHPLKNLNAMGDSGFIITGDGEVAERIRRLRNHGLIDRNTVVEWGTVARMDGVQAAILNHRLGRLDSVIERRRANAERYRSRLDPVRMFAPPCRNEEFNTFHTFVIQVDRRDELQAHLAGLGIGTAVHYPVPIHLQPAARYLGYRSGDMPKAEEQAGRILSLPIHQHLDEADIDHVADAINRFLR